MVKKVEEYTEAVPLIAGVWSCITVSFEVSSLDTSLLLARSFLKYNKL